MSSTCVISAPRVGRTTGTEGPIAFSCLSPPMCCPSCSCSPLTSGWVAGCVRPALSLTTKTVRRTIHGFRSYSVNWKWCQQKPYALPINRTGGDIILNRDSRLLHCRRRVARTLMILAIVFALCWMPYNIIQLYFDHLSKSQLIDINETAPYLIQVFFSSSTSLRLYFI